MCKAPEAAVRTFQVRRFRRGGLAVTRCAFGNAHLGCQVRPCSVPSGARAPGSSSCTLPDRPKAAGDYRGGGGVSVECNIPGPSPQHPLLCRGHGNASARESLVPLRERELGEALAWVWAKVPLRWLRVIAQFPIVTAAHVG